MATITITIPDDKVPRIVAALKAAFPEWANMSNAEIARQAIRRLLIAEVQNYEEATLLKNQATQTETLKSQIETDLSGIS